MIEINKRKELGQWLRNIRKRRGFSLTGAARRLGYATKGTLTNIECGIASIPIEQIHPLARLYEIDLTEFLRKLAECEPDLYRKFALLEKNFRDDFMSMMTRVPMNRSSLVGARGPDGERIARHHAPFPSDFSLPSIYYQNLQDDPSFMPLIPPEYYQMEQMTLDLREPAPRRPANVHPLFPALERAA